ncbi:MAG: hypothetical protein A2Z35_06115 [Actinobacteria bacterium RBG_19FT_COMBO_36_27]|nr:MAG: hypothetical protein A2Z35_06115 [Actinobacteria bacterium RBG_19FT_COMBO_36_27]
MNIKKFYLLNSLKDLYDIAEDGTVTNKKNGKILKYSTHKGQRFVSLYLTGKSYQYTERQLKDFLSGEYNKKNKCKICNCVTNNDWCNMCQLKLQNVKNIILKTREGKRLY